MDEVSLVCLYANCARGVIHRQRRLCPRIMAGLLQAQGGRFPRDANDNAALQNRITSRSSAAKRVVRSAFHAA